MFSAYSNHVIRIVLLHNHALSYYYRRGGGNVKIGDSKTHAFNKAGFFGGVSQLLLSKIVANIALSKKMRICINSEKEDNLVRYTQIFDHFFSQKFPFYLTFIPKFLEFQVEWFAFRKLNNFRIFWNFSQEISSPFVPVSEFLVER